MSTTATAPGKLVLLGEYVVLEGAPALVAAMDRRAQVHAQAADTFRLTIAGRAVHDAPFALHDDAVHFADPAQQADPHLHYFRAMTAAAARMASQLGGSLRPCHLQLDTQQFYWRESPQAPPQKLGLGSSAALSVALLAAYLGEAGLLTRLAPLHSDRGRYQMLLLAQEAHSHAQRFVGSGVDVAASVYGGILRFERKPGDATMQVRALPPLPDVHLLPVWSGASASTTALVGQVRAFKQAEPKRYWQIFEKLGTYAHAGAEFWALGHTTALCTVVDAYYATLVALGEACGQAIITPTHAAIAGQVRAAGASYKSSGAGGGDLGVAMCVGKVCAQRCRQRLRKTEHSLVAMHVDPRGLEVEQR